MAYFDRERQELVVRIVYDGPATAGKTASLRSLHASFGARATGALHNPAETTAGRTLYFDWLELLVGYVDDWPLRCQILTVPGQLALAERRFRLLREIDAVVFVCESTPTGVRAARVARAFLDRALAVTGNAAVPVIVQANKQDLEGALSPVEIAAALAPNGARLVFPASAIRDDGVRQVFLAALGMAREALRGRMRSDGPDALSASIQSADQLHQAMLSEADAAPDPRLEEILEAALGHVPQE